MDGTNRGSSEHKQWCTPETQGPTKRRRRKTERQQRQICDYRSDTANTDTTQTESCRSWNPAATKRTSIVGDGRIAHRVARLSRDWGLGLGGNRGARDGGGRGRCLLNMGAAKTMRRRLLKREQQSAKRSRGIGSTAWPTHVMGASTATPSERNTHLGGRGGSRGGGRGGGGQRGRRL